MNFKLKNLKMEDDEQEQEHFKQVVASFFFYTLEAMRDIARMERDFAALPQH